MVAAPVGLERVRVKPSSGSTAVSPAMLTVMSLELSPAAKLTWLLGRVPPKSAGSAGGAAPGGSAGEASGGCAREVEGGLSAVARRLAGVRCREAERGWDYFVFGDRPG